MGIISKPERTICSQASLQPKSKHSSPPQRQEGCPCGKMADWFKRLEIPARGQSQIQECVTAEIVHDLLIATGSDRVSKGKGQNESLVPITGIRFLSSTGEDSKNPEGHLELIRGKERKLEA